MRQQFGVLDDHRKCFGHKDCGVEGPLGKRELLDWPAVEAEIRVRLATPCRDHRRRSIDPDDLETIVCQKTAMRGVAARDVEDAPRRTFAMPLPDLLQEDHFSWNFAGALEVRAAEDIWIKIDARFHRR